MSLEDRDSAQTPAMSDSEQESPGAREPACMLCHRAEADPDMCGEKLEKGSSVGWDPAAATSCALPGAVGLPGEPSRLLLLLMGLLGSFQYCCVCGQSGATIMCSVPECDRWFHLPCAKEGGCVNLYVTPFSSFCPEHRPEQEVEATPEPDTVCTICMEPVEDRKTFTTLVCPTCKRAWFHRDCIQGQAMRAGLLCLRCPLCRDSEAFLVEMFILGIRIPFRPWQLLLCSSCAAEGTHRRCSGLRNSTDRWECDTCAGLGTYVLGLAVGEAALASKVGPQIDLCP
ncbi:PHD finger protein 7-like [Molothrus ater]|uniref:PHD finger protein 7-like n=1 Tax=Molothrus ater TaxID=84834 RepID=UPI0023E856D1|nr:PHD finger protein 7-like [Molothrus ater]